jgi:hypothetical protein
MDRGHMPKIFEAIRKRRILLPVILVLFLCTLSVYYWGSPLINPPTPTSPPPEWFTDWLQSPACQPPCWQGITPGITALADAAIILGEIPWIKITFGPEETMPDNNRLTLEWQFGQPSSGFGRAYSDDQGNITTSLSFQGALSTALKEVVGIYGVPSDVFIPDCQDGRCRTQLIYLNDGMVINLGALKPDWREKISVTPDTEIRGIEFFPPGEEGFIAAYPQYTSRVTRLFSPWDGYSKYIVR